VKKKYGAKEQFAKLLNNTPTLDKAGKKFIQEVTGVFLFLARAVDGTMLTPLSTLASEQSAPTEATMKKCLQFLNYMASQDNAILTYKASDMVLVIHSDASYLSEPKACSRTSGYMFMAGKEEISINNGAALNISQIIKQSCHPPQRPSLPHCSSMPKQLYQCINRMKNLVIRKREHQYKPTTQPRMPYSPMNSSRRRSKITSPNMEILKQYCCHVVFMFTVLSPCLRTNHVQFAFFPYGNCVSFYFHA
jgi:hypothetical protein